MLIELSNLKFDEGMKKMKKKLGYNKQKKELSVKRLNDLTPNQSQQEDDSKKVKRKTSNSESNESKGTIFA